MSDHRSEDVTPAPQQPPTLNQRLMTSIALLAAVIAVALVVGIALSRSAGLAVFSAGLFFIMLRRTRAPRPQLAPKPAALPAALVQVRGAAGHLERTGAKLKHAILTGLVLAFTIGGFLGVLAVAAKLRGPTAAERRQHEERRQEEARRAHERRCPGIYDEDMCRRYERFRQQIDERRRIAPAP